jgi:hypothetical protein
MARRLRGWFAWRRRRGTAGVGNALLAIHALLEPDRRHAVEERQRRPVEEDVAGEPPDPEASGAP